MPVPHGLARCIDDVVLFIVCACLAIMVHVRHEVFMPARVSLCIEYSKQLSFGSLYIVFL